MSPESRKLADILLVVFPTVIFGGVSGIWGWANQKVSRGGRMIVRFEGQLIISR